jgi:hypothetical protein
MATVVGHPLLVGDSLFMLSQDDLYLRWQVGERGEFITIAHPLPKTPKPDLTPTCMFGGYPLAQTPAGLLFADDHVSPFIGVFNGPTNPIWHDDIENTLGIPAVSKNNVFTNLGGDAALAGIVAVNSSTGETLWRFAPKGLPEEPVAVENRSSTRALSNAEQALVRLNNEATTKAMAKAGVRGSLANANVNTETTNFTTPVINAEHGHWRNPGLSVVKNRVYGQVEHSIVAIDQASGVKKWSFQLRAGESTHSLVTSPDYLFVSLNDRLIALDLENGEIKWDRPMQQAGSLALSKGLLFFSVGDPNGDGGEVTVFQTYKEDSLPRGEASPVPPPRR